MTPSTPDAPEDHSARPTGQLPVPRAVTLVSALVLLQGAAMVVFGAAQTLESFLSDHVMPLGAIVLMSLLYAGYGIWLIMAARSLRRGGLWPRALILVTQVFMVVVSVQLGWGWAWPLAIILIALAVVIIVLLFSSPVQRYLLAVHYRSSATHEARSESLLDS